MNSFFAAMLLLKLGAGRQNVLLCTRSLYEQLGHAKLFSDKAHECLKHESRQSQLPPRAISCEAGQIERTPS